MASIARVLIAGAALAMVGTAAQAQECPSEPVFVAVSGPNSDVRASVRRLAQSEWVDAAYFAREALDSGTSRRNKAAAAANLCFALAKQGDEGTAEACDDAVTRAGDTRWEAYNNRGAAHWLSGNLAAAQADFAQAVALEGDEEASANVSGLAACVS